MAKNYNTDDILNSISWQLKRIADNLDILTETHKQKPQEVKPSDSTKLRKFLNQEG